MEAQVIRFEQALSQLLGSPAEGRETQSGRLAPWWKRVIVSGTGEVAESHRMEGHLTHRIIVFQRMFWLCSVQN